MDTNKQKWICCSEQCGIMTKGYCEIMTVYSGQCMDTDTEHTKELQFDDCLTKEQDNTDKTQSYTEADWKRVKAKADDIHQKLAVNMDKGPNSPEVQMLIGELRQHITEDVCYCTPEVLKQLGNIYVFNKRFTDKVDHCRRGFAAFVQKAIYIYCDNVEGREKTR